MLAAATLCLAVGLTMAAPTGPNANANSDAFVADKTAASAASFGRQDSYRRDHGD